MQVHNFLTEFLFFSHSFFFFVFFYFCDLGILWFCNIYSFGNWLFLKCKTTIKIRLYLLNIIFCKTFCILLLSFCSINCLNDPRFLLHPVQHLLFFHCLILNQKSPKKTRTKNHFLLTIAIETLGWCFVFDCWQTRKCL